MCPICPICPICPGAYVLCTLTVVQDHVGMSLPLDMQAAGASLVLTVT